jgi:hypothetical protein
LPGKRANISTSFPAGKRSAVGLSSYLSHSNQEGCAEDVLATTLFLPRGWVIQFKTLDHELNEMVPFLKTKNGSSG